jgi:glycosyltransferase involved in cell wall biosynthesis
VHRPLVSVIIPNYNNVQYLGKAIQSVLGQTYSDYEIIVIDDGSTDNSHEVVASFGERVHYIWQENKGLGGARNTGIRAAQGEFISLLDADDEWLPAYLERMVGLTTHYPSAAVYYCAAQSIDTNGNDLPQVFGGPLATKDLYQTLLRANFIIPSTVTIRRSVLDKVGLFEQEVRNIHGCEDWDLWLRIAPQHIFIGSSDILARYRLHSNTFSANPEKMQRAVWAVVEKQFGPDNGQPASWKPEKRRAYGGVYRYFLLTSIQRQDDWTKGAFYLRKAIEVDPSIASDINMFYELALGSQPIGLRDTNYASDLNRNADRVAQLLLEVFPIPSILDSIALQQRTYGTAYYALGLAFYNLGNRSLSRSFFIKALRYNPKNLLDTRMIGNLCKSLLPKLYLERIKNLTIRFR